jgi:O-antigen/teichoic acid export membrane protein
MTSRQKLLGWLKGNRTSVRMAFGLRIIALGLSAALSFVWTPLLLRAMGDELNGLFVQFQKVLRLGGLGDLGMGAVVGVRGGEMLARGDEEGLRKMLASARVFFAGLGLSVFVVFAVLSPWLPNWRGFQPTADSGSIPLLFVVGGVYAGLVIFAGYFHSLNYAHGTVTWPILPTVLIGQTLAPFAQWLMALHHAPLWAQYLPHCISTILTGLLAIKMLRWSHPWLGELRPLALDFSLFKSMAQASGWLYLLSLGNAIYTSTDALVIGGWFGSAIIPAYNYNYRICDLGVMLVQTCTFVSLPKITQWFADPNPAARDKLRREAVRLNIFQIVLGCAVALFYLTLNDLIMRVWLGPHYKGALWWQAAFAANLAVTTGGDAGIQISTRCGNRALKIAGLAFAGTGVLNLGLSILSAKLGSITGIAVATVIAQSVMSLVLGWLVCRHLGLSAVSWSARSWLLPLSCVVIATCCKSMLPNLTLPHILGMAGCSAILLFATCALAGLDLDLVRSEWKTVRSMLKA